MGTEMTVEEMVESLTGWDEIAIEKSFGADIAALQEKGTTLIRALCFVEFRRNGKNDGDAKSAALDLSLKQAQDFFAEDDELIPSEPVTDAGKDATPPA